MNSPFYRVVLSIGLIACSDALRSSFIPKSVSLKSSVPSSSSSSSSHGLGGGGLTMKIFDWKRRENDDGNGDIVNVWSDVTTKDFPTEPGCWGYDEVGEQWVKRESQTLITYDNLVPAPGSRHRKKRKGRGIAAGQGASCGFGMRGQKSRSGRPTRPGFEGGQNPLYRRLPKFVGRPTGPGHKKKVYNVIKLDELAGAPADSIVNFDTLRESKAVTKSKHKVHKIVSSRDGGEDFTLPSGITVQAHAFTKSARAAIEEAGGTCQLLKPSTGKVIPFPESDVDDKGMLPWDGMFELLERYKESEGGCNDVARGQLLDGKSLGLWLFLQRQDKKKGAIDPERSQKLENLGVVF